MQYMHIELHRSIIKLRLWKSKNSTLSENTDFRRYPKFKYCLLTQNFRSRKIFNKIESIRNRAYILTMIYIKIERPFKKQTVGVLTSFHFNVFLKNRFDMLSQCLVSYVAKKVSSYSMVLALKYKVLIKVF